MNIRTKTPNPFICNKILNYLRLKIDAKDSLDGILLGLFPDEIDNISKEILNNLEYLISIGKIQSYRNGEDTGIYKIVKDQKKSLK